MKKKVLMSVGSLEIGGNEVFAMNVFKNIDRKNFDMDFVIFDDEKMILYDEIIHRGGKVWICTSSKKNKLLRALDQAKQVYCILKKERYDIIHCNSCSDIGIIRSALPAHFIKRTKVITHAHNVGESKKTLKDFAVHFLCRHVISAIADYGFACSLNAGESKYTKSFINSKKFKVINNAINVDDYKFSYNKRDYYRKELNIDPNTIVLGTIARLDYQKNVGFMIEFFTNLIKSSKQKYKLLIIGEGVLEKELKEKASSLGVMDSIIFAGRKKNASEYYNVMDCFILTSLFEGLPFVLVEAQLNGLQCYVSDRVSTEVNVSGTIRFIPLEIDDWVEMIRETPCARIGAEEIKKVLSKYDMKNEIKNIEKVYSDLCRREEETNA